MRRVSILTAPMVIFMALLAGCGNDGSSDDNAAGPSTTSTTLSSASTPSDQPDTLVFAVEGSISGAVDDSFAYQAPLDVTIDFNTGAPVEYESCADYATRGGKPQGEASGFHVPNRPDAAAADTPVFNGFISRGSTAYSGPGEYELTGSALTETGSNAPSAGVSVVGPSETHWFQTFDESDGRAVLVVEADGAGSFTFTDLPFQGLTTSWPGYDGTDIADLSGSVTWTCTATP